MSYQEYKGTGTEFYETTPEVAEIVNLAIKLGRPILVEGEAGCGKTMRATSIAHELGLADRLVVLPIKSTSQAKELLYRFDALRRLQDTQLRNDPDAVMRARHVYPYITLQPLGDVIRRGEPAVVLIDEIDKADIDFPNDLLDVLGEFTFIVEDLPAEEDQLCHKQKGFGRTVNNRAGVRPAVVVTSNREKQLPEPFLRRCLYLNLRRRAGTDRDEKSQGDASVAGAGQGGGAIFSQRSQQGGQSGDPKGTFNQQTRRLDQDLDVEEGARQRLTASRRLAPLLAHVIQDDAGFERI